MWGFLRSTKEARNRWSLWKEAPALWEGKASGWHLARAGGARGAEHRPPRPRGGVRICAAVSWWFGGERQGFLGGPQSQGSGPWPRAQHCPRRKKNIPKKKSQLQMSPCPAPHPGSPAPPHPGLCAQPGGEKPPPLGLLVAMIQGLKVEAGGRAGLRVGGSVRGRESVHVPGPQTLASSISRKSLCMGTLPCSLML